MGQLLAAVVTAAAAIIAALIWMRPSPVNAPESTARPSARVDRRRSCHRAPPPRLAPAAAVQQVERPAAADDRASGLHRETIARLASIVGDGCRDAVRRSLAPLSRLEAIEVAPIAQTRIAPADIVVAPLSPIAELQISPLEPRTAR